MSAGDALSGQQFPGLAKARSDWLGDHSMDIAGAAGHATEAKGWSNNWDSRYPENLNHARTLISAAKPVGQTLYHGVPSTHSHKVGDRLDIPLKATTKSRAGAEDFAKPSGQDDGYGHTVYEFQPGAHATEIHAHEHVVTGRYEVTHAAPDHVRLQHVQPLKVKH